MRNKLFTIFLVLAASIGITNAAIVNGTCGENLTWSLNTKDSTLTIEGSGVMDSAPWGEYINYIAHVSLPEGLSHIAPQAFFECEHLKHIDIPNSVVQIGNLAFGFSGISTISLGNGVQRIGAYAFSHCNFTSITLPNSVTQMGKGVFSGCISLTLVILSNQITKLEDNTFSSCSALKSLTIPNSVTTIGKEAFHFCDNLETITIPNSVTSIGSSAFYYCSKLTDIEIPNSTTTIETGAFFNCLNLTTVTLGKKIADIGHGAFSGCPVTSLTCLAITPPSGGANCGINPSTCHLYVPSISLSTYQNSVWWEEFSEIIAIPAQNPIVTFVDWDGTILSSDEVEEGSAAIPPANPMRDGYTFIGWDKDFSNVTEDMTITALYKINRYRVEFVDWDNSVLKSDSVDWNSAAIAPFNPYRKGYTFKGWDKDFEHVTSDLTIKALYEMGEETDIIVRFTNDNNENDILHQSIILKVPEAPEIEGFTFLGWQPVAKLLEDDIEIRAIYKSDVDAAPEVYANPSNPTQKLIREGNVYILHEGKSYSVQGIEVK